MALYDNKHWLLSHIRDNFISTDATGLCEEVMVREDIPKQLKKIGEICYPDDESDGEDLPAISESHDTEMDIGYRPRSNTAQRLQKMDIERRRAAKIKHIKWEPNPVRMTEEEKFEMFKRKDLRKRDTNDRPQRQSLFSEQFANAPLVPKNPFIMYKHFDGNSRFEETIRKYRIYMCMLSEEERKYPLQIVVVGTAKVQEFIGLICYKYACEHPFHSLKSDINEYGLYITEDDGEVDWDFPCLDPREIISKFEFPALCLMEMTPCDRARHDTMGLISLTDEETTVKNEMGQEIFAEDLARMERHTTAMGAPLYQSFRVYIINKVRAKTEIHLGISGEKIEIDPVTSGKGASRFWHRQRAVSYQMDNIAWCELIETKGSKTLFTLVYTHPSNSDTLLLSSRHSHPIHQSTSFKTHDFEADTAVAEEIVRKINLILELRISSARKEFITHQERKAARRKSFSVHR